MKPVSEEALLEAVKKLVTIESTADNPAGLRAAYDFMRNMLLESGKDITIEEFESNGKPSLITYRGQNRPKKFHIILNGHVDVVPGKPEQYIATVKDNKLYGRGVYDMKAAAIVLAAVFCEYVDAVPYALGLQIVTDEENAGKHGTLHQVNEGVRADFVVCGDCGRSSTAHEIANEAKGIAVAEICFRGASAHGAYPWRGENAAMKALDFLHRLHERYPVPDTETSETTITVTSIIATSDAHTKTPDHAIVRLDGRYTPHDPHFQNKAAFAAFIAEVDPDADITNIHDFSAPAYTSPTSPLLLELKAAAERVEGATFSFVRRNGTGDGRFYGNVGGEACEFGIAGEHQHGDDEHITLEAFHNYLATMRLFLQETITSQHPMQSVLNEAG